MQFDPNNKIVKLCAKGMEMEANQKPDAAKQLFLQAWNESTNDFEKFTSAHYVARHQDTVDDKLKWDEAALSFALKIDNEEMKTTYSSLYLNIAKCYEDLYNISKARENYQTALAYLNNLPDDGYGRMIKAGIENGLERISKL